MVLALIYQRQKTSEPHPQHKIYQYLLELSPNFGDERGQAAAV